MGETDEADKLALIEEATSEAERDITKGTELIAGNDTETDEARDKNLIRPDLQVPAV